MEKIDSLKRKIKVCDIITVTSLVLIIVCIIAEVIVGQVMADNQEAGKKIINGIASVCYVLPVVAMVPLFFRVNFNTKLKIEQRKEG